jgi:hypothetical protein
VSLNKYCLDIPINKKWLENQNDPKEDKYESPTLVYYRETNTMVPPLVRDGLQTPSRMQGCWNDDDAKTLKVVVKSSKEMDSKPSPSIKGSP